MTKPNVFIRGIYSTALTKLFMDAGFPIIFPSESIQKRFDIPFRPNTSYSKDITIKDRYDRQGVRVLFKKHIWDQLKTENFKDFPLMQANNPDLITFNSRFMLNSIYRGMVVRSDKQDNYSFIRLTPDEVDKKGMESEDEMTTTFGKYQKFIPEGKEGIFQVTHEDCGKVSAQLGSYYTIPGDLIVINPFDSKVIISKEITNGRQKKRLFDLGKSIQNTKKYGFIFRTAAELATDQEIIEEVNKLDENLIATQTTITQFPDRIGEIFSNYVTVNVIFPNQMKRRLDSIRNEVIPTIEYHHAIKSDAKPGEYEDEEESLERGPEELLLDYSEKLMENLPQDMFGKVSDFYMRYYLDNNLQNRSPIRIFHQKLSGRMIQITSGFIQSIDKDPRHPIRVTVRRKMREGGTYDGLSIPIEEGDYAISEYTEHNWYYQTNYYSSNNDLKGKYFNINTPIEIRQGSIRYIDLEIDVVENFVGERKIIDKEFLDRALELQVISQEIYDKALQLAGNIVEKKI